jgi:hypothetical protein
MNNPSDKYATGERVGNCVIVPADDYNAMKAELDELSPKEPAQYEPWVPNTGEECWVWGVGGVAKLLHADDDYFRVQLAIGNVHRTEEEAEAYGAYLQSPKTKLLFELEQWLKVENEGVVDREYLFYLRSDGCVGHGSAGCSGARYGLPSPHNEDIADRCIEHFGQERLSVLFKG